MKSSGRVMSLACVVVVSLNGCVKVWCYGVVMGLYGERVFLEGFSCLTKVNIKPEFWGV